MTRDTINDPVDSKTELSVKKIHAYFKEFGFNEEAQMVARFLRSVGKEKVEITSSLETGSAAV